MKLESDRAWVDSAELHKNLIRDVSRQQLSKLEIMLEIADQIKLG